jgi:hypothetical protein
MRQRMDGLEMEQGFERRTIRTVPGAGCGTFEKIDAQDAARMGYVTVLGEHDVFFFDKSSLRQAANGLPAEAVFPPWIMHDVFRESEVPFEMLIARCRKSSDQLLLG